MRINPMPIWSAEIKELEKLYESFKGQLPELEKELLHLIKTDDENVILLYARRCLEIIITDLCECELKRDRGTEPLKGIIDKLNKEKKIPAHIVVSMQNLNTISTFGTHPKDFDPEQVKPVLNNLGIIIKWYLKYKDSDVISKQKSKEVKDEGLVSDDTAEKIQKPKKRLILLLSGLIMIAAIVVVALFVFDIIGSGRQIRELEKSIAVLPFFNDSQDQENAEYINGMMDEILNNLQRIKEFRVPSRTSTEQYRGESKPSTPEIARQLDVNYVVEGSGQKIGNTIRLRVQLIVVNKGRESHLWGESYEQDISDAKNYFILQSRIAESIANELKTIMTPEEQQLIEKIPTENQDALYAYLLGKEEYSTYLLNGRSVFTSSSPNSKYLNRAEDFYHQALRYDPEYAEVYIGLATVYWDKHFSEEYFSKNFLDSVLVLVNKALSYDNNLAEAYSLRGDYYGLKVDYENAVRDYKKTLEINPNYWQAYAGLANLYRSSRDLINSMENYTKAAKLNYVPKERLGFLRGLAYGFGAGIGFYDKAIEGYKEGLKLDDDSLRYYRQVAGIDQYYEKYSETIQYFKRTHELDPGDNNYYVNMGKIYYILGQKETAAECYKKYISGLDTLGPQVSLNEMLRVGFAYLITGHKQKAEEYFELQKKYCEESIKLNRPYAQSLYAYYDLACVNAIKGDKQNAYRNLHTYNDKIGDVEWFWMVWYLKTDPLLESIRNEPEFQEIFHEIETKYNNTHKLARKWLEENNML